ncbi:MAG TPA: hypothetical protein ENJ09_09115 [Planctomycetes bacterium]|nr:hypothetical protein [Planctomycetota bacterium]
MSESGLPSPAQRRVGFTLIAVGILTIIGAVLWVVDEADGPGTGPKTFAERRSYNQVKESIHETFPLAFCIGLGGLGVTILGSRLARWPRD